MRAAKRYPFRPRVSPRGEVGLAPMLPFIVGGEKQFSAEGLVDSGSAINVLPFSLGANLGFRWHDENDEIDLGGLLNGVAAKAIDVVCSVGKFPPIELTFAWVKTDGVPLLLGQFNFFLAFDVCFFRSVNEFPVRPAKGKE